MKDGHRISKLAGVQKGLPVGVSTLGCVVGSMRFARNGIRTTRIPALLQQRRMSSMEKEK